MQKGAVVVGGNYPSGTLVGRFEVRGEVGRGATGVVLRAWDPRLARDVALKLLAPERLADTQAVARFQREATACSRLKHPHLAAVYELADISGEPVLVMEWIEGQTLQQHLQQHGPLGLDRALRLTRQLAEGLDYAHQHGVVHRDVKCSNIILQPDGRAILVDFGLATVESSPDLTATGTVLGTPLYMAPEQIRGASVDGRADLYSLALVFYEMVTGEAAFHEQSLAAVLTRQLHDPPPRLSGRVASFDARKDAVLAKALAKSPAHRYPTAGEFVAALEGPGPPLGAPGRVPSRALVLLAWLLVCGGLGSWYANAARVSSPPLRAAATRATPATGAPLWSRPCPPLVGLTAGAGRLFAATESGRLQALDPGGRLLWDVGLAGPGVAPPVLLGSLVLATSQGRIEAFDLESGKVAWSTTEEAPTGVAVGADETAYVALWEQAAAFSATGEELWRRDLPGTGEMLAPLVAGGTLYLASEEQGILSLALEHDDLKTAWKRPCAGAQWLALEPGLGMLLVATSDQVLALSAPRGQPLWSFTAPSAPVGLAVGGGLAVVTCEGGQVLALETDGSLRWQVRPENELETPPALRAGEVLVAGSHGLYRLDRERGQELGRLDVSAAYLPPLTLGDRAYVAAKGTLSAWRL